MSIERKKYDSKYWRDAKRVYRAKKKARDQEGHLLSLDKLIKTIEENDVYIMHFDESEECDSETRKSEILHYLRNVRGAVELTGVDQMERAKELFQIIRSDPKMAKEYGLLPHNITLPRLFGLSDKDVQKKLKEI